MGQDANLGNSRVDPFGTETPSRLLNVPRGTSPMASQFLHPQDEISKTHF